MKTGLQTDAGYFDQMKGAKLPKLRGTVKSAEPKRIVLALSDPNTEEVALEFETPVRAEPGAQLTFEGVAKSFTKEPFMLTMEAERGDVQGLSGAPAGRKPAASKAKPRRR
jgi:hypothetical protein